MKTFQYYLENKNNKNSKQYISNAIENLKKANSNLGFTMTDDHIKEELDKIIETLNTITKKYL